MTSVDNDVLASWLSGVLVISVLYRMFPEGGVLPVLAFVIWALICAEFQSQRRDQEER